MYQFYESFNSPIFKALSRSRDSQSFWGAEKIIDVSVPWRICIDEVAGICFAFAISELLLPAFNIVFEKHLSLSFVNNGWIIAVFFLLSVITGLIAGSYPAFYLSSFKPVKVLKGTFSNSFAAVSLRKGLVVFQFVISVMLIVASVVIAGQMHFLRSADLGFDKDRQIVIPLRSDDAKNIYTSFKNELSKLPQVESVGASSYYPGMFNANNNLFYKDGQTTNDAKLTQMNVAFIMRDYLKTLNIKPVAGRLFSKDFPSDTKEIFLILNETAVNQIGFCFTGKGNRQTTKFILISAASIQRLK